MPFSRCGGDHPRGDLPLSEQYLSWGGFPRAAQSAVAPAWREDLPCLGENGILPRGNGRSYGDSCLAAGGQLVDMRRLDRFMSFDATTGRLRVEAGILLDHILTTLLPAGWCLPVCPGTSLVTVGGAIANDVHGKNHHKRGSFGNHVIAFELVRSDGERVECSRQHNVELFTATIGGLGLTGFISWAELQLVRVASSIVRTDATRFQHIDDFFELSDESDRDWEFTVAWVDGATLSRHLGRGLLQRGNFCCHAGHPVHVPRRWNIPATGPCSLVRPNLVRLFNEAYIRWPRGGTAHLLDFLFPLDAVENWNRLYGRGGFMQYQCVLPPENARQSTAEVLRRVATSGKASALGVLKKFGSVASCGLLSFPRPGTTLALDFVNDGIGLLRLLADLDDIVASAGGAVYPAKDARMSGAAFKKFFPKWQEFEAHRDPRLCSLFWQRVTTQS